MQFIRRTEEDERSDPEYEFDIGPSFTWKPSEPTRFDIATLFGTTDDSPAVSVYAVFSIVINPLKASGYLTVTRGVNGGYVLGQRPEEITMLDVLTTLEGPVSILKCLTRENECNRIHSCVARTVWKEVNNAVEAALSNITLAEVLRRHKHSSEVDNYAI